MVTLQSKVGMKFEPFTFKIEKGKIKEFALAIGDPNPYYQTGEAIPPTFATVMEMWAGSDFIEIIKKLELNILKVLHGEQEFVYLGKIKIGDKLTGETKVTGAEKKSKMDVYRLETTFKNESGEIVLISRNTVVERY